VLGSTRIGSAARQLVLRPNSVGTAQLRSDAGTGKFPGAYSLTAETTGFYPDAWKLFA
jgi:hypothetical protein